jgi:hypothetical protein
MKLAGALILTALVAASATSAEALSVASAEATLDWTGFTFTTTGTLSPIMIVYPSSFPSVGTFTTTTPTTPKGSATASASAVNGFLAASAGAEATAPGFANVGQAGASALSAFLFYATGSGELVVTVPYQLELSIVETSDLDLTSSSASVFLSSGPDGSFDSDSIELTGAGTMTSVGSLTAAIPLGNATFGPLLNFHASADVRASAAVPEAPSRLLLGLGILALGLWQRRSAGSPRN